jgi:hypothetical protein
MTTRKLFVRELRDAGVLPYEEFNKEVERYEPYTDKLSNEELMAYFISRAKIEVLSQAFMHMENPVVLKEHLLNGIRENVGNIHTIKGKLVDKLVRN